MNICLCGTVAGYLHDEYCPYPLYHGSEQQIHIWTRIYSAIRAHYLEDGHDSENFRGCTHSNCEAARKLWRGLTPVAADASTRG